MLSDERITKIFWEVFDLIDSRPVGKQLEFIHAIEREATAPLIEQIKEDEALMRDTLEALSAHSIFKNDACDVAAEALRQRLEAKK